MGLGIINESLPHRFISSDVNKDQRGLGTLARTMEVCEEWVSDYYGEKLSEKYLKNFDTSEELLDYLYDLFGRPPLPTENPKHKELVMLGIVSILKTRGTLGGINNYFNTLSIAIDGLTITLPSKAIFDINTEFDSTYTFDSYNDSSRYYEISFTCDPAEFPDWQFGQTTQEGISRILAILEYLLPVGFIPTSISFNGIIIYNT